MIRLALVALLMISFALPAPVAAQAEHECAITIAGLRECVQHAAEMGHITNRGITQSLLAKIDAAQAAADRGQPTVAISQLHAFIGEVGAQSGRFIIAEHAAHMIQHAEQVIDALGG
jgi:hypothetical protein